MYNNYQYIIIINRNIFSPTPTRILFLFKATEWLNVDDSLFSSCMNHSTLELT